MSLQCLDSGNRSELKTDINDWCSAKILATLTIACDIVPLTSADQRLGEDCWQDMVNKFNNWVATSSGSALLQQGGRAKDSKRGLDQLALGPETDKRNKGIHCTML